MKLKMQITVPLSSQMDMKKAFHSEGGMWILHMAPLAPRYHQSSWGFNLGDLASRARWKYKRKWQMVGNLEMVYFEQASTV